MNEKKPRKYALSTRNWLLCKVLIGGYLLYNTYQIVQNLSTYEGNQKLIFGGFSVVFVVVGVALIVLSIRDMMQGYYVGGPMDPDAKENAEVEKTEETQVAPRITFNEEEIPEAALKAAQEKAEKENKESKEV